MPIPRSVHRDYGRLPRTLAGTARCSDASATLRGLTVEQHGARRLGVASGQLSPQTCRKNYKGAHDERHHIAFPGDRSGRIRTLHGTMERRLSSPFLEFAGTKPGDRVLDVGCGTGILTCALAERGSTVVGIDASEAYVAEARRHRSNPEVTYDLGDVRHLPYAAVLRCLRLNSSSRYHPGIRSGRPGDAPRHAPWRGRRVRSIRFLGRLFRFRPSARTPGQCSTTAFARSGMR